ncbi:hypothetical protein OUZ56_033925 [Daphnia magna]|uniref:Uncharacterized protein n=1 Tax=Daphnia magna TaxID=35525 RepID=A0ABR0BBA3_9CRUS|nr:hypothetical protein OUZ56_033925 [Daphnia magna]
MSNHCSHETLLRVSPPGSLWSICYYHQDLHRRRLRAGSRPQPFNAHRRDPPTRRGLSAVALCELTRTLFALPTDGPNRCGPPPGFPLASSWPGIGHHLSGPNVYALGSSGRLGTPFDRGLASIRTPRGCARSVRDGITPRGCTLIGAASLSLRLASFVIDSTTRAHVRLLGPCFKTGRVGPDFYSPLWASAVFYNVMPSPEAPDRSL